MYLWAFYCTYVLHSLYAQVTVNILKYKNKLENTFQRYDPIRKLKSNKTETDKYPMLPYFVTISIICYCIKTASPRQVG